ncbi:MAG: 16S rRNA (cytidine(1402)-2'-O)-methyltransferase [Gammaproteobacteria bacterium]|nr:16S rRNA (cytidine(1402)-2'-O)-methyltransferase [Gammaproteobacteria bacterium]
MSSEPGKLFVVATPIGNLKDITERAIEVLSGVDCIAAEDTRHSARLLEHYGITSPMSALHEHNEQAQAPRLVERMQLGESVALISDAGTPLVSDPGLNLVRLARQAGISIIPIPGASAAIAAMSVSGLPSDRFCFEGFLPAKASARRKRLTEVVEESRTLIFYEAPHRILDCLADMVVCFGGERPAVMARELTKRFETVHGDNLAALQEWVASDPNQQKGEFVILVHGAEPQSGHELDEAARHTVETLLQELPLKQAVSLAVKITGLKKNAIYQYALSLQAKAD